MKTILKVGLICAVGVLAGCATVPIAQVWINPQIGSREDATVTGRVIAYYRGRFVGRYTTVGFEVKATDFNTGEVLWKASHSKTTRFDFDYDPALLAGEVARELVQGLSTSASVKDHKDISDIAYSIRPFEDANAEKDMWEFPEAAKVVSGAFETAFLQSGYRVVSKGKAELLKEQGTKVGTSAITSDNQVSAATAGSDMSWEDGRVVLVVDRVEKGYELSAEIKKEISSLDRDIRNPSKGNDYVAILLIFQKINGVHVTSPGQSILHDTEGRKYMARHISFRGVQFLDPHSIASPCWVTEGAVATLLFEVPQPQVPDHLTFVYRFKEGWDQVSEKNWNRLKNKTEKVEIDLPKQK